MRPFSERDAAVPLRPKVEEWRDARASIELEELFGRARLGAATISLPECTRSPAAVDAVVATILDSFGPEADCLFARIVSGPTPRSLSLRNDYTVSRCAAGGWLLAPEAGDRPLYWIPQAPVLRTLDSQARILSEKPADLSQFVAGASGIAVSLDPIAGACVDLVIWRFAKHSPAFAAELDRLLPIESQGVFLWGSHARLDRAGDLYRHLVHGAIYDARFAWPFKRKCCSENEAHSIYVALAGLGAATGKRIYRLLRRQIVLSVLARQAADGAWRHGLWTDDMECHYRLHASAVHLLLDELEREPSEPIRVALDRGIAFLRQQTDSIDAGAWFLHDSLEKTRESLAKGPFKWVDSRALGKSTTNMLVLNTHLDATIAIDRYAAVASDAQSAELVASARKATERVLSLRSFDALYRALFAAIELTLLPTAIASRLSLPRRAVKRIAWRYVTPRLAAIKSRWPRLRMPNGYIDRELSLKTWAFDYHAINLMDLLRYHRRFHDAASLDAAREGIAFARRVALPERWAEVQGKDYALGFWAEALYHGCTLADDAAPREALSDAILRLADLEMGMPASLLGANAEAVALEDQRSCSVAADARLRVANLSRRRVREILVVNPSAEPIALQWLHGGDEWSGMAWLGAADSAQPIVPARGFLRAAARRG